MAGRASGVSLKHDGPTGQTTGQRGSDPSAYRVTNHYNRVLQPFNGLFSRTTWVSRYQKGKTNLDFTGARDSECQWHQLGHMQVCTLLQTASTHIRQPPPLCFYRPDALSAAQPTASKHTLSLASVKSRLVLPFLYRLTRVVPDKGPLNVCVCVCAA